MADYYLGNIRALLTEGFTDEELRVFCFDEDEFREVYNQLGQHTGKGELIQWLLEHAERKSLFRPLLAWAEKHNPTLYEAYQPYKKKIEAPPPSPRPEAPLIPKALDMTPGLNLPTPRKSIRLDELNVLGCTVRNLSIMLATMLVFLGASYLTFLVSFTPMDNSTPMAATEIITGLATFTPLATKTVAVETTGQPPITPANTATPLPAHTPTGPVEVPSGFESQVQVKVLHTDENVPGAVVTIQVSGETPVSVRTDSNGTVTISITPALAGQSGELIVEANGFQDYREVVDLVEGALPELIELERAPPTPRFPAPTATPGLIATPAILSTPAPASPAVSGQLAIPLKLGNEYRVYLANFERGLTSQSPLLSNARQPLFSADGQWLLAIGTVGDFAGVFIADRNGQSGQQFNERSLAHWPVWSPDGSQIIFADLGLDNGKLVRQNRQDPANFSEVRANNITLVGRNLIWTNDNRLIFRECGYWLGESGTCGIWVTQPNTPDPQRILDRLDFPAAARNGLLAYLSNIDGDWEIYLIPLAGGEAQNLTNNGATIQDGLAAFSPDGRTLAYVSNESGAWAVWTISLSNFEKRQWFTIDPQFGTIDLDSWAEERMSWGR